MRFLTGLHAIEEYLKALDSSEPAGPGVKPLLVFARSSKRIDALKSQAKESGVRAVRADAGELDARVGAGGHRGVLLEVPHIALQVESLRSFLDAGIPPTSAVLALDGITDPHNLGAILRSADQFGVDLVVLPPRRSAHLTDTVFKTSSGAAAAVPMVTVPNLTRALIDLKEAGFWLYGADVQGRSVLSSDMSGRSVLVLGSEGEGLGRLVKETCDELVKIPSFGAVDSLNVSVATGVLLYEMRRQQGLFEE